MINLEKFNLNKGKNIVIGVSGGSDSMSLLDILCNAGYKIKCVHINYHKRKSAIRDENIVKEYCVSHSIEFFKFDSFDSKNNFQDYARDVRYNYFKEIYDKYDCQALFTAHQLNDKLETYLFKKERNSIGRSLSIEEEDYLYGMRIIRPLLDTFKIELEKYCVTHSINYGIDESNLTDHYTRNIIRHHEIDNLNKNELNELIYKMNKDLLIWKSLYNSKIVKIINNIVKFSDIYNEDELGKRIILCEFFNLNCPHKANLMTSGFLKNCYDRCLKTYNSNKTHQIIFDSAIDSKFLIFDKKDNEYILYFKDKKDCVDYIYKFDNFSKIDSNLAILKENNDKKHGIYLYNDDFPITIRTYHPDDYVLIKDNKHQKISRLFINKKIPFEDRKNILLIINKNGEVLLVNGLYRRYDRKELKNNIYMLK